MRELGRLFRRAEFLAVAAQGRRWVAPGMIVQFLPYKGEKEDSPKEAPGSQLCSPDQHTPDKKTPNQKTPDQPEPKDQNGPRRSPCLRYGLTASKKVGNAVIRNRARRRLRALAEEILPQSELPCGDIVLIARRTNTISRSYDDLRKDLRWSIRRLCTKTTPDKPPAQKNTPRYR